MKINKMEIQMEIQKEIQKENNKMRIQLLKWKD